MEVGLLRQAFLQTLVPNREPRKQAEEYLRQAAEQPGYGIAVLGIVSDAAVDEQCRQAAAVNFKNHVKFKWSPADDSVLPIQDAEKDQIKALMVRLMLSSPPRIQNQLSEALALISSYDFPGKWQGLLPELVGALKTSTDYTTIKGILQTVNSIFKHFRYKYKSNELYVDLKYCLDGFAPTLLEIFLRTGELIRANQDPAVLKTLFESQRLCCRIFYSLNSHELPEFFEDHMQQFMEQFDYYLQYQNPALRESDQDQPSVVDEVKAAVCENINLYMEKNEEEFQSFLQMFARDVWQLLTGISLHPAHDRLAMSAMRFLTTVSKSVHHTLFSGQETLRQICEGIVIPNVRIRTEDEELFEMNPLEYIRKDMEGSDLDTRRRMACELVKGLSSHYREQIVVLMAGYIQGMVARYSANPVENWKDKDCAIYLIVSLAQKQSATGAIGTDLVNVDQFFTAQIIPELQTPDINSQPLLKADALKFITTFRTAIPRTNALSLLPFVTRFLLSESNVVHSYAAGCIEKMLMVKDGREPRISAADITAFQDELLGNLFNTLRLPESRENAYVMKCIMRVLSIVEVGTTSVLYLEGLVAILKNVCNNPTNPFFNHYAFEALAALVSKAGHRDQEIIMAFENQLFPLFQIILQQNVTEFQQYAFQLLALLIESRNPPIPVQYLQIFPGLLLPDLWQRSANVPAMVRLLQAFLLKAPMEIAQGNQLQQVLEVFGRLVARKSTEDHAFYIINTMVESLALPVLAPFVPYIWSALFNRLMNAQMRTLKFLKSLVVFMSLFLVKHGQAAVVDSVNTVSRTQPTLFTTILQQFWIPTLPSVVGVLETKLCAVASTKLLCESRVLLETDELWGQLLNSTVKLLIRPDEDKEEDEEDVPDMEAVSSYSGGFAQLHNAGKREADPIKDVRDAKEFLCTSLSRLSAQQAGRYPAIIQRYTEAAQKDALLQMCTKYGAVIA